MLVIFIHMDVVDWKGIEIRNTVEKSIGKGFKENQEDV